ncbi:MAG: hypothetical protein ACFBSF_13855 [Leptolyngbyaceae cyanobacterium]
MPSFCLLLFALAIACRLDRDRHGMFQAWLDQKRTVGRIGFVACSVLPATPRH